MAVSPANRLTRNHPLLCIEIVSDFMLTAIPDWPEEIVQNSLISLSFFRSLSLFA